MREIVPGIHHWTGFHPKIRREVSSYYVEPAGVVIDPMVPAEGLEWFEGRDLPPQRVVLSCRHHLRDSERFAEAFGCDVRCCRAGLHEFADDGPDVAGFDFGDEVAPGVTAIEIDAISPDETALHVAVAEGAVLVADGAIRPAPGTPLSFVPDYLMDDPPGTKAGLKDASAGCSSATGSTCCWPTASRSWATAAGP